MLDNPERTAKLLAALKAQVPFEVELVPSLVSYLRAQHIAAADQSRHVVSDVSYAGDEGGIVCRIVPPKECGALVISLTQVRGATIDAARPRRRRLSQSSDQEAKEADSSVEA